MSNEINITIEQIEGFANICTELSRYSNLPFSLIAFAYDPETKKTFPTTQQVLSSYNGLPDDHPLKKRCTPENVNRGLEVAKGANKDIMWQPYIGLEFLLF